MTKTNNIKSKIIKTMLWITMLMSSIGMASSKFPVPVELQANVQFWENIFESYSRNHYVIHDDVYLDLVYQVVVSDDTEITSSAATKKRVSDAKLLIQKRLKNIAHFNDSKLTPEEKSLKTYVNDVCGEKCIKFSFTRVRVQRGIQEKFHTGFIESQKYNQDFVDIFREAGIPAELLSIAHVESSFINKSLSKVGAAGIWQFMPKTAKIYGLKNVRKKGDERLVPNIAARAAAKYLSDAYTLLGSWPLAISSYNVGVGGIARAKKMCGEDLGKIVECYNGKNFKFASRNYYAEVVAAMNVVRRYNGDINNTSIN